MKKPDWTDAEFEVVEPQRPSRRGEPWNGIGLPPEWDEATWYGKLLYLAAFGGLMSAVIFVTKAALAVIF